MTAFDALATAIRERLISGRPAPLPGLGTLVRQHVSARVEERPDGTRVLLPPGETIGLAETETSHESLATAFGRLQALPEVEAEGAYARAMDQLEAHLAATGEVRLPGVGLLRRTSGGVVLGVEASLLAEVNRAFEGLSPVGADPASADPAPTPLEALPEAADDIADPEAEDAEASEAAVTETDEEPDEPAPDLVVPDEPALEEPASESDLPDTSPEEDPEDPASTDEGTDEAEVEDEPMAEPAEAEGIPVPFGSPDDPAPAEAIPPTPAEADPSFDAASAEPEPAETLEPGETPEPEPDTEAADAETDAEDWASETWTASSTPPPGALGINPRDLIEDADFEVLPPEASPIPAAAPVPPEAEMAAMLATPVAPPDPGLEPATSPDADTPPPSPEAAEPAGDEPASGRGFGWIWGLLLLALLIALALWAWSSSRSDAPPPVGEPVPQAVEATEVAPPDDATGDDAAPAQPDVTTRDPAAAPAADAASGGTAATPTAAATPSASTPTASVPQARPASGTAISPPRLDGLDEVDRRALVGGPIDPAMGGWTLVVASLRSEEAANEESALYAEAGYRTGVFAPSERGQTRYRVAVGQFGSEAHALRLRERLPPRAPADTWPLNLRSL